MAICHAPFAVCAGRLLAGSLTLGLLPHAAAGNGGNGNNGRACPAAVQLTFLVRRQAGGGWGPAGHVSGANYGSWCGLRMMHTSLSCCGTSICLQVPPKKAEPPAAKDEPAPAPAGEEGQEGGGQRFEARLAEALRDAQVKFLKVRA